MGSSNQRKVSKAEAGGRISSPASNVNDGLNNLSPKTLETRVLQCLIAQAHIPLKDLVCTNP
jgi:hypothetical protein